MQAYFEPGLAFSISMLQPVFEISIACKKNMYSIIFLHMDTNREELKIKVMFSRLFQGMLKVFQNYVSKN